MTNSIETHLRLKILSRKKVQVLLLKNQICELYSIFFVNGHLYFVLFYEKEEKDYVKLRSCF